jgi:hypothetical protein
MRASTVHRKNTKLQKELTAARARERKSLIIAAKAKDKADVTIGLWDRMNEALQQERRTTESLRLQCSLVELRLEQERTVWRLVGMAIMAKIMYPYFSTLREYLLDMYAIWRLDSARRDAIELNDIPLRRMARRYWQWDKDEARRERNAKRKFTGRFQAAFMEWHKRWLT